MGSRKAGVVVLSLAVYFTQPQKVRARMVQPVEKRACASFSTPLVGCMAVGSEHLARCKHCRKQASSLILLPSELAMAPLSRRQ